jgi:quercetin dioxygenase-like cupin family protein
MQSSATSSLFRSAREAVQPVREGIRKRALVLGDGLQADEIFFDADIATTGHAHALEQAAYTVSGWFEVTLGDARQVVGPGDAYRIPAGADHAVHCLQAGSYVLITALTGGSSNDQQHDHEHGHDHDHGH